MSAADKLNDVVSGKETKHKELTPEERRKYPSWAKLVDLVNNSGGRSDWDHGDDGGGGGGAPPGTSPVPGPPDNGDDDDHKKGGDDGPGVAAGLNLARLREKVRESNEAEPDRDFGPQL